MSISSRRVRDAKRSELVELTAFLAFLAEIEREAQEELEEEAAIAEECLVERELELAELRF